MADKTEHEALRDDQIVTEQVASALNGVGMMALPEGYSVHDAEKFFPQPRRTTASYSFRDTKSLATYLNRFATDATILFSKPGSCKITAQVDHDTPEQASHRSHSATFAAQWDDRYSAWRQIHDKLMSQTEAGLFLEERAMDITEPDAASVMDIVMTFDAVKKVSFRQSTRLHSGQRQFTYVEDDEQTKGNITLPERLRLRLPIFEGQEPDMVDVLVRYRIDDGKLRFAFKIHNRNELENVAFERCEDSLQTELQRDLMLVRATS